MKSISNNHISFLLILILLTFGIVTIFSPEVSAQNDSGDEESDDSFWEGNYPFALTLIVIGVLILLAEPFVPGLFLAIPGTVLVSIGAVGLAFPDLMFTPIALFIGILAGVITFFIALKTYQHIAPTKPPTTTVADSLIGKEGIITTPTDPDHGTKGKVRIDSQVWSAHADTIIPVDTKVKVIKSEGVHVKVERISPQKRISKTKEEI
jgi:membrane protein implicated in regulation of membrane protease activity